MYAIRSYYEQAKSWKEHEAQEMGVAFDPESVTGPMTIWRLAGIV